MLKKLLANLPRKALKMPNPIKKITSKSGKEIDLVIPSMDYLNSLLTFVNRLVEEDTFLTLTGKPKTLDEEQVWLNNAIVSFKAGKSYLIWALQDNKIVGACDIHRGITREWHVGKIGLMVDHNFRNDGIGKVLLETIIHKAKDMDLKIVAMDLFSDNTIALSLYKKFGFKEYGRLPKGLFRKNKFSDTIELYLNL